MNKILFRSLSNLGDIVLTTPVLRKLVEVYPDSVIEVAVGPAGKEIFEKNPHVDKVIILKKHRSLFQRIKFFYEVLLGGYDVIADMKGILLPFILGKISLKNVFSGSCGHAGGVNIGIHKKYEHLSKLRVLGIIPDDTGFFMPVTPEDDEYIKDLVGSGDGPIVVISPGSKSHLKRWGINKYAELSDRLAGKQKCRVVLVGNEDDVSVVKEMAAAAKSPVLDLSSRTSVCQLAALMKISDILITNDSAPLHIASAMNTPTVAVFGPSNDIKYGPLADNRKVVKPDVACRPCENALCSVGPDEGCITQVTVEEVYKAVMQVLGAKVDRGFNGKHYY